MTEPCNAFERVCLCMSERDEDGRAEGGGLIRVLPFSDPLPE